MRFRIASLRSQWRDSKIPAFPLEAGRRRNDRFLVACLSRDPRERILRDRYIPVAPSRYTQRVQALRRWIGELKLRLKGYERVLVIWRGRDRLRASLYAVSMPASDIRLLRRAEAALPETGGAFPQVLLARLLRRVRPRRPRRAIIAVDHTLATTVHSTVLLVREHPEAAIDESDLEQHVSQAIWRFADRERGRAAAKMGISELALALHDARVRRIRLDGHRVVNPVGFRARVCELMMSQTFAPKGELAGLQAALPGAEAFVVEAGAALAETIARGSAGEAFAAAIVGERETALYRRAGSAIAYVDTIGWGRENVVRGICDAFSVRRDIAEAIIGVYLRREASARVLRALERILVGEFQLCLHGIAAQAGEGVRHAYLAIPFEPPPFLMEPRFARRAPGRLKLTTVDAGFLREHAGVALAGPGGGEAPRDAVLDATAILAFHFLPADATMDVIARRHARWLMQS